VNRILVFDLWGEYAHFKKHYTTTSPLSFPFPPRTTISGMIAAMLGIDKEKYLDYFLKDQASIGIRILRPLKRIRITENFINTKDLEKYMFARFKNHTQIRLELIKDPVYRIYFSHRNHELFEKAAYMVKEHKCFYTVSLGLSELIGNFSFVGECPLTDETEGESCLVNSVIPDRIGLNIEFETGKKYFSTTMPMEMTAGRIVTEYCRIFYEGDGRPIKCSHKGIRKIDYGGVRNDERIIFL